MLSIPQDKMVQQLERIPIGRNRMRSRNLVLAHVLFGLPTPAEASSQTTGHREGFAQAGKPVATFPGHALKSASWFAACAGLLLLVGGCAAGPSYNWGW